MADLRERLKAYEDIGLTPEQLREVDRLYAEKCKELADAQRSSFSGLEMVKIWAKLKKLKEYNDLEEQGKLLKLPCAVGDTVYAYCSEFGILEYEVDNIVISKDITYQCSSYSGPVGDCLSECLDEIEPDISDFGKTVFLAREEAEAALKELDRG